MPFTTCHMRSWCLLLSCLNMSALGIHVPGISGWGQGSEMPCWHLYPHVVCCFKVHLRVMVRCRNEHQLCQILSGPAGLAGAVWMCNVLCAIGLDMQCACMCFCTDLCMNSCTHIFNVSMCIYYDMCVYCINNLRKVKWVALPWFKWSTGIKLDRQPVHPSTLLCPCLHQHHHHHPCCAIS